ncbi:MAG: chemotaxis protein CheR [Deltaproteobacteria bacterium]|nr:chemotaxis protein CheR [Deltaproteobacteria bacterium]
MSDNISPNTLADISKFIASHMGLHFPKARWDGLEQGIESAARDFGYTDTEEFIRWLMASPLTKRHIEILASHLTVGETYFFREKETLAVLEEQILPELIRSRQDNEKRLRIWSAGCSTGEEAYSVAILLSQMIPDLKEWNITILATDINPRALKKGAEGVYTEWSFRNTPAWLKQKYFKMTKQGRHEILPQIKKMVMFEYLNLAEDVYPSLFNNTNAMDLIFCRNVLMYFSAARAKMVVKGFYNCLVNNGWLIVSPVEAFTASNRQFVTVNFPDVVMHRKAVGKTQAVEGVRHAAAPYYTLHQETSSLPDPTFCWAPHGRILKSLINRQTTNSSLPIIYTPHQETMEQEGKAAAVKADEIEKPSPYMQAKTMFEQGRYDEASERLAGLLSNGHGEPRAIALMARVCANQGRLDDALCWCKKAISFDTLNQAYYYLLAIILQEQGMLDQAVDSLKKAIYLDQNFVIAYFSIANIMTRLGRLNASRKYLKNASDLLSAYKAEQVIPESEGITAGRLSEIIESMRY